jgi:hypothetical protein
MGRYFNVAKYEGLERTSGRSIPNATNREEIPHFKFGSCMSIRSSAIIQRKVPREKWKARYATRSEVVVIIKVRVLKPSYAIVGAVVSGAISFHQ